MSAKLRLTIGLCSILIFGGLIGFAIATRVGTVLWPAHDQNRSTSININEPITLSDLVAKSDMIVDAQITNVTRRGRFVGYNTEQRIIILADDQSITEHIPPDIPLNAKIIYPETPPPPPPPGIPFTDVEVHLNQVFKGTAKEGDTIILRLIGHVPLSDEGKRACLEVSFSLCVTDDRLLLLLTTMPDGTYGLGPALKSRLKISGEDLYTTNRDAKLFEMEGRVIKLQDVIQAIKK